MSTCVTYRLMTSLVHVFSVVMLMMMMMITGTVTAVVLQLIFPFWNECLMCAEIKHLYVTLFFVVAYRSIFIMLLAIDRLHVHTSAETTRYFIQKVKI